MVTLYQPQRFTRLPDAILFDTDNTLYPYAPAHAAAQQAVREKVTSTLSLTGEDFDHAFKKHAIKSKPV